MKTYTYYFTDDTKSVVTADEVGQKYIDLLYENGFEIEDKSPNVDEALIAQETSVAEQNALQNALLRLKERDRQVIRLFYYEKKTQVEIAEILGVSQQVVSYRLSAALERLKKIFKEIS